MFRIIFNFKFLSAVLLVCLLGLFGNFNKVYAQQMPPAFVNVVNPVRGSDFWDLANQKPSDAVIGEIDVLKQYNVGVTWLIRFDALNDSSITSQIKNRLSSDEAGLFLEVTPSWTSASGVAYHHSSVWHDAASVFLTGYSQPDREKLIDTAFEKFKSVFGYYPKSVGAWWIDSYSLEYMREKYGILASLEVADQYSTDDYQIWGQYWSTPYYPAKRNALFPAQSSNDKIGTVTLQWAARDPVNGYGDRVEESTYSVQANDYMDYHGLNSGYFASLVDLYTKQSFNKFNQLTVGLENSYQWSKYGSEYQKQIQILANKRAQGQFSLVTMSDFASWYDNNFPDVSPRQIIVANDPLGTSARAVWFMNPYYRAGWFYDKLGSEFKDIRAYIAGSTEICFSESCDTLNFGSTAIRVLDSVSFGKTYLLDQGSINNFRVDLDGQDLELSYTNEAGVKRDIIFLPRDISINGVVKSIDTTILNALNSSQPTAKEYALSFNKTEAAIRGEKSSEIFLNIVKFLLFLVFVVLFPGFVWLRTTLKDKCPLALEVFLSLSFGLVGITLVAYFFGYLHNYLLSLIYIGLANFIFFKQKLYKSFVGIRHINFKRTWYFGLIILLGSAFQYIPVFRSGFIYDFGMGFWGPNSHDGVWHLSLVNQLIEGLPPNNPVFSGVVLKNYHYLYDLLLAITNVLTAVPVADLLFRLYPLVLSLMLGVGTYLLSVSLFKKRSVAFFSVFFVYFAGSFGWIVDYIHQKTFSGESDFWANQSISFNLNPPFAISLVLIIATFLVIADYSKFRSKFSILLTSLLIGSLIGFKSYAGILILGSLFGVGVLEFIKNKSHSYLVLFITSLIASLIIFLPNFTPGEQFFVISPFWLVNSIIDFPDRVGWLRLSAARQAYLARGQVIKFTGVEVLSLIIFLVGNLGMRFIGLGMLGKIKKNIGNQLVQLMVLVGFLSLIIPLVFVQKGTAWNVVQFFYYFMFLVAILAGGAIVSLYSKLPKVLGLLVVMIVLILTPINSISTAQNYNIYTPHTFISFNELDALNFLAKQPKGTVLTYPYQEDAKNHLSDPRPIFAYDTTSYVGAFSKKGVYLEDLVQNDILQTRYVSRLVASNDFFNLVDPALRNNFLKRENIKYIYLVKYFNINLDTSKLNLKKIFDNPEVSIYETN